MTSNFDPHFSADLRDTNLCEICGLQGETKHVKFEQNIGLIFMRQHSYIEGRMCKACIDRNFWNLSGKTMLLGWWGVISAFATPVILLLNIVSYLRSFGMKRPRVQIGKGASPIWTFTTIAGFVLIGLAIISIISEISSPTSPSGSSQPVVNESCSIHMVGLETWITLRGRNVEIICDQAIQDEPGIYQISYKPPNRPVICRETLPDSIEVIVIDTSSSGIGGNIACKSLYEELRE